MCANGTNPTTELLCASIIPFTGEHRFLVSDAHVLHVVAQNRSSYMRTNRYQPACGGADSVARIQELYCHSVVQSAAVRSDDIFLMTLNSTVSFFREVFVDTDSDHILQSLRAPLNGVWTNNTTLHREGSLPVATCLFGEIKKLAESPPPDGILRGYIFEEVVVFFTDYAKVLPLQSVHRLEQNDIKRQMSDISKFVREMLGDEDARTRFSKVERAALSTLATNTSAFSYERELVLPQNGRIAQGTSKLRNLINAEQEWASSLDKGTQNSPL